MNNHTQIATGTILEGRATRTGIEENDESEENDRSKKQNDLRDEKKNTVEKTGRNFNEKSKNECGRHITP